MSTRLVNPTSLKGLLPSALLLAVLPPLSPANADDAPAPDHGAIVVAANADPTEKRAAEELRDAVKEASGAELKIVTGEAPGDWAIRIGGAAELKTDDLGDEGFTIRIADRGIDIAGGSPRGTLYGVYTALENGLGVRYLTADCASIPRTDTVEVKNGETTFRPRFSWRNAYYKANYDSPELAAHMRNNAAATRPDLGGGSPWSLISHTVHQYVPVARYGESHPEYFSLVDGKRRGFMKDDQFDQGGTQPCFTNPEVRKLLIDGVLADLERRNQTDGVISISQNDNMQYCQCPDCAAIDEREGSHMGSLLTLLNEAADAVAKVRPGVSVGSLAYQHTRKPPLHLKPRPNVAIQLCSIECCQIHPLNDPDCALNQAFCKDMEDWCKITDQVYVWNYNVSFTSYNLPCPNLDVIGPNVKFIASQGVKGVFMQCAGDGRNTDLCELRNYLISRLLWDPTLDDRRVKDEFIDRYYGRAAGDVRAYLKLIAETPRNKGIHHGCFGVAADYGFDADLGREALAVLEKGMSKAENQAIRDRVEKLTIGPRTILLDDPFARWVRANQGGIAGGQVKEAPAEAYQGHEAELRELFRLYEKFGVDRYSEGLPTAPLKAALPASIFEEGRDSREK